jgi:hypothetical protein
VETALNIKAAGDLVDRVIHRLSIAVVRDRGAGS